MESPPATSWLATSGPDSDVVLSSRARLARNIDGFPFICQASSGERVELLAYSKRAVLDARLDETMLWVELNHATPRDRKLLVERHLISTNLAEGDQPRAVAISGDESLAIMVNEEDHLRMQVILPGSQVAGAFERINRVDDAIESRLDYAFSDRFGYLTACPTNVGTGLRLSVMVHLPALKLTAEVDKVRRAAKDLQLAVRGFYGEGSEAAGDFYQVSNQITLGVTEATLLKEFERDIVPQLVEYERAAREVLLDKRTLQLDDRVWRALGVLRHARLLAADDAMKLLSRVRLGVAVGRVPDLRLVDVDRLFTQIQPAHIQQLAKKQLADDELAERRAELVRTALSGRGE